MQDKYELVDKFNLWVESGDACSDSQYSEFLDGFLFDGDERSRILFNESTYITKCFMMIIFGEK